MLHLYNVIKDIFLFFIYKGGIILRVWTIQPEEVWSILQKEGIFTCNQKLAVYGEDFKIPYAWMVKQMDNRGIHHPEGLSLPIWAWHTRNFKHKKPDLRESGYDTRGTKSICLEVEINDTQVLLSDYDAWHFVLNDWWLDDSNSEEEWEIMHKEYDSLPYDKRKQIMEESWQKIFDLTPYEDDWRCQGKYVQACFWKLKLSDVKKVQHFVCR